ncbi:exopolysaccharide Pel transporter PelG [Marinitoga arctica]
MAGVGFRLTKMFSRGGFSSDLLAVAYSVVVSSGPWIITTLSLWVILNLFKITNIYFNVAIVYSFIISIIISGLFIMFESRRISDLIFLKKYNMILPEVLGFLVYSSIILLIILLIFFAFNSHELWYVLSFTYLSISLLTLWIIGIASISTDNVNMYILSFLIMGFFSIVLSNYLGSDDNPAGYLLGYAFGVNIGTFSHYLIILYNFGAKLSISFDWMDDLKKYWQNIFIGFFYYLSIWIDDFVMWYSPIYGEEPIRGFHFSYIYDNPMFLAYLTIIPTATMFILVLETRFYKTYRFFYDSLIEGYNYSEIEIRRKDMEEELKFDISLTVKVQLIVTLSLLFLNEINLVPFVSELVKPIFRMGIIGAMMNSFYLTIMLLILYFDFRNLALTLNISVFIMNLVLSIIFHNKYGHYTLGASYTIAFTIGTFIGYKLLIDRVENLIEIEYFRQKLAVKDGFYIKFNQVKKLMEEKSK